MPRKLFGFTVRFHIEADDRRDVEAVFRDAVEEYAAQVAMGRVTAPGLEQEGDEYYTVEEVEGAEPAPQQRDLSPEDLERLRQEGHPPHQINVIKAPGQRI